MARRKPVIISEVLDSKTYVSEQILQSDGLYAVFYEGKPFGLRMENTLIDYPGPKYKKTAFPSSGHAHNLAERLNAKFNTDKFEVYKLTTGEFCDEYRTKNTS